MKATITELMPQEEETVNVQGRVQKSLRDEVQAILSLKNWGWGDFLTAAMKAFVAEHKGSIRTRRQQ